jgi:lactate permease
METGLDLIELFILAILPIFLIFIGLVFLKISGIWMSIAGWAVTGAIAVVFFNTSPQIIAYASLNGILASFGISLMVLFTILQVTMMDMTGAIVSISAYIKSVAAERYEQIMVLNVGLGSFLVSIGATPVTMMPPIMMALGFSPLVSVALPCLGYDPLTSFSLLAVPITLPAAVFGLDPGALGKNIALFIPLISTGLSLGMLWIADGVEGMRKGLIPAVVAGLSLGISCIFFVQILPPSAIGLVGVFSGLVAIVALLLLRFLQGKPVIRSKHPDAGAEVSTDLLPLWKALLPWGILLFFIIIISIPAIQTSLYSLLGPIQKIHLIADKSIDLKLLNQAYFWVLVSTLIAAPLLVRTKKEGMDILALWIKRAWSPTLAAAAFFAIAYIMDWSGQTVIGNTLTFASGTGDLNMNAVIGLTFALAFGAWFPIISPFLGLFGSFVSGSETSSNIMFYGILKKSTAVLSLDLMQIYAAHAVAGGIASGIAPVKIMNAAAVIDHPGIVGEVIKKSLAIVIVLTVCTGLLLVLFLKFLPGL